MMHGWACNENARSDAAPTIGGGNRPGHGTALQTPPTVGVPRLHEPYGEAVSGRRDPRGPRQPVHAQSEARSSKVRLSATIPGLAQTVHAVAGITHSPLGGCVRRTANRAPNRPRTQAARGQKHDPGALAHPHLALARPHQCIKLSTFVSRQGDRPSPENRLHSPLES